MKRSWRRALLTFTVSAVSAVGVYVHQAPTATAGANVWENFKRIKQGEAAPEDEPGSAPAAPGTAPPNSANPHKPPQPAVAPAGPATPKPPAPAAQNAPASTAVPAPQPAPAVVPAAPALPMPGAAENALAPAAAKPDPTLIHAPAEPTQAGGWWNFYAGTMDIDANPYYDPHGIDFKWAYSRRDPLPRFPRVVVHMHGSGGGQGSMEVFGPSELGDIEVRTQDAEAYSQDWREWWTFGRDGTPYPGRRIAATLEFLQQRYNLDLSVRGIVLQGPSMGGAGAVVQTMILPAPWRERIAYSSARAGVIMPRQIARRDPAQYANFPPDDAANKALWDSIDFAIRSATDRTVQNMHYRHAFSSDDQFSAGVGNASTQLEFVNLVEQHRIGGAFGWVKAGHATDEQGVKLPDMSMFETAEQDVSLDRAHPAITRSTGNYPLQAKDRINHVANPRGHYNMGITWDHAKILDERNQVVFPLKYQRRTGIGGGLPDQPERITVSVTPRRARHFEMREGETLKWSWNNGALSGTATVAGGTVTVDAIPLVSGEPYRALRIYR